MENIYNCHTHVFTDKNVPVNLMPLGHRSFLIIMRNVGKYLNKLKPRNRYSIFDKITTFTNIGNSKSQLDIFDNLKGSYPNGSKFVVLSLDMDYMEAGKVAQGFLEQLRLLSDIKKKFQDQVLPFIFADPRRPNITDLVKEYIEERDFHGIKMNPTFGYYPFDKRLHNIFKYAEANKIPIISHCARSWAYYKGEITNDMLTHPETGRKLKRSWKKKFAENFTHPGNYEYLLRDFPDLKICLAHLGGVDELKRHNVVSGNKGEKENWSSIIIDYIKRYPNVYTDVSYTMHDGYLFSTLRKILEDQKVLSKVLYGSDFYMVQQEISESDFHVNLKSSLGESHYYQIAKDNPQRFLSMTNS